jgi:hypothetical protein
LITLKAHAPNQEIQPSLRNRHTTWDEFRQFINERLTLNVSLETEEDIEGAVKFFNDTIQWASWNATPEHTNLRHMTRALPIESLAHHSGRTLVCAEYGYPKGSPNTNS